MTEIFKDIEGYEGVYQISNIGRVKSLPRKLFNGKGYFMSNELILKQTFNKETGYLYVVLCKEGKVKSFSVHRLVAKSFLDNPLCLSMVNHKDEDKTNNCVDNLEWCDANYNNNYGTKKERLSEIMKGKPGRKHTEEHKKYMSDLLTGRKFSEEHKQHLKDAWKNRVVSEEDKERLRTMNIGHKHAEETRKKMSEARKKWWETHK